MQPEDLGGKGVRALAGVSESERARGACSMLMPTKDSMVKACVQRAARMCRA